MVFQHFNLFLYLTVHQNIMLAPKMLKGVTEAKACIRPRDCVVLPSTFNLNR